MVPFVSFEEIPFDPADFDMSDLASLQKVN